MTTIGEARRRRSGRGRGRPAWSATAAALVVLAAPASAPSAATPCSLTPGFGLAAEERAAREAVEGTVVVTAGGQGGLAAGDVIRQANGRAVRRCGDLERAAAEALAEGLVLLLGVERGGGLVTAALTPGAPPAQAVLAAPAVGEVRAVERAPAAAVGGGSGDAAAATRTLVPAPVAMPAVAVRESALPLPDAAASGLRDVAALAAAALGRLDETARPAVPLALYERRVQDAERVIAALAFGADDAGRAVRAAVGEILAYHQTARAIRRERHERLAHLGIDPRGPGANAVPFFSDSQVPLWVAAYPFLDETLLAQPFETRFPLPGEAAGRWNPARAVELLWARARAGTGRLAAWVTGPADPVR